jgi:hypothetical protein
MDILKLFLQIAWENKLIPSEKYIELSTKLQEIGRMLGGWKKGLLSKTNQYSFNTFMSSCRSSNSEEGFVSFLNSYFINNIFRSTGNLHADFSVLENCSIYDMQSLNSMNSYLVFFSLCFSSVFAA